MKTNILIALVSIVIVILSVILFHYNNTIDDNNSICRKIETQIKEYETQERNITNNMLNFRSNTSSELVYLNNIGSRLSYSKFGDCISTIYWVRAEQYGSFLPEDITRFSGNVQFISQPATMFNEGQITIKQNNRIVGESVSEYIYSLKVYDNVGYEYYDNKRQLK